jgi:hypothetical protein
MHSAGWVHGVLIVHCPALSGSLPGHSPVKAEVGVMLSIQNAIIHGLNDLHGVAAADATLAVAVWCLCSSATHSQAQLQHMAPEIPDQKAQIALVSGAWPAG